MNLTLCNEESGSRKRPEGSAFNRGVIQSFIILATNSEIPFEPTWIRMNEFEIGTKVDGNSNLSIG